MEFSLLMSVYQHDNSQFFEQALQSIDESSIKPTEVILVCDGELTIELDNVINGYRNQLPINLVRLVANLGLGFALQKGLEECKYEWVARFDADDICRRDRFEKQIIFLQQHPEIDVLGGQIIEFSASPEETSTVKKQVPFEHGNIQQYAKLRNPINHMTVMFRKSAVLQAGNYQHAPLYEDYELWVRMLIDGCKFANMNEVLVDARAGTTMYERRGGIFYAKQEFEMQRKFQKLGFISSSNLIKNLIFRIPVRLMPNKLRGIIYSAFLRH